MNHVALIRRSYDDLTQNEKRLADCILSSPKAAFLTTTDLAKFAKVSQSAVVRFAQTLGYPGYLQLQKDLQDDLIGKLNPSARLQKSRSKNIGDIGTTILDTDIGHLENIRAIIRSKEFEKALSLIEAAERVYVIGIRASHSIAHLFAVTLGYIKDDVKLLANTSGAVADEIVNISRKDVLVAFSFPRYSVVTIKALKYASSRGCKSVVVTDSALSPSGRLATVPLPIPVSTSSFFTSYTAAASLTNVIIAKLTERQGRKAVESLNRLDDLLEDWGHWTD